MKKTEIRNLATALFTGLLIGSFYFGTATAVETPAPSLSPTEVLGEVISVCIDKKTGVIRASFSCKKTERATVLGGAGAQGPKGEKGDTGAMGATGPIGPQGFTGPTGAVSGLRTTSIDFLSASSFGCPGWGTSQTVVTNVSSYTSSWSGTTTITPTTTRLYGCSATVYTR